VEVDAVKGCEPKEAALRKLHDFLSSYCNKPDGIEIVRSDVIPVPAARGVSAQALARKYMNGPDSTNTASSAYLYVLYYDDTLSRYSGVTRFLHRGANPYTEVAPYPAIYLNTRFSLGLALNGILLHEAGHALGLVDRQLHARNGHCRNGGCLMGTHVDYLLQFRWLPGRNHDTLCSDCVAELSQSSTQQPPANLRFVGPVLVRSEAGYHVLNLPGRLGVVTGALGEQDCQKFAMRTRAETPDSGKGLRVDCLVRENTLKEPSRVTAMVDRLKTDPFEAVRIGGPRVLLRTCAQRCEALGQYSNAIAMLRQAVQLDPNDDWSYNMSAWIKATCPDESIRNGKRRDCSRNQSV
jgi:hypothetical protein